MYYITYLRIFFAKMWFRWIAKIWFFAPGRGKWNAEETICWSLLWNSKFYGFKFDLVYVIANSSIYLSSVLGLNSLSIRWSYFQLCIFWARVIRIMQACSFTYYYQIILLIFMLNMQELENMLSSVPITEPKYQLSQVASSPFWILCSYN